MTWLYPSPSNQWQGHMMNSPHDQSAVSGRATGTPQPEAGPLIPPHTQTPSDASSSLVVPYL